MNALRALFGRSQPSGKPDSDVDVDAPCLQAEPISRKRMDLLWLDPPRLAQLEQPLKQHGAITIVMGDSESQREHEITQDDYGWAKQVERIVDQAFASGQRGDFRESIRHYQRALELAPGCDLFLMSIGVCYARLGEIDRAIRYLQRANGISPTNARIRENLAQVRGMQS